MLLLSTTLTQNIFYYYFWKIISWQGVILWAYKTPIRNAFYHLRIAWRYCTRSENIKRFIRRTWIPKSENLNTTKRFDINLCKRKVDVKKTYNYHNNIWWLNELIQTSPPDYWVGPIFQMFNHLATFFSSSPPL